MDGFGSSRPCRLLLPERAQLDGADQPRLLLDDEVLGGREVGREAGMRVALNDAAPLYRDAPEAKEAMIRRTDTEWAPWTTVKSNDKKRARINAMRHFLSRFDYEDKDVDTVGKPAPAIVRRGRDAVGD